MSDPVIQLTLEGGEVEMDLSSANGPPLTSLQKRILGYIRKHGEIRSTTAGVMVHEARGIAQGKERSCGAGARSMHFMGSGEACCPYATQDGLDALKRLADRGYVVREEAGRWKAALNG